MADWQTKDEETVVDDLRKHPVLIVILIIAGLLTLVIAAVSALGK